MTITTHETARSAFLGAAPSTIGGALRALVGVFKAWYVRRAAYRQLMALDDRMLADIGLARIDIDAAVNRGRVD